MPRTALFIPCYIDQLYPQVGLATLEILEHYGVECEFPATQTCCGQPMANTGCDREAEPLARKFVDVFRGYDSVVCPSGSCVAMVRHHYDPYLAGNVEFERLKPRVFELCEFLGDVLGIDRVAGCFPHKVGLHQSCHGLRELRLGSASERVEPAYNKVRRLLESLEGIEFAQLSRADECCGFGGTFAVNEEAVSCMMGDDRLRDHRQAGTEVLTGNDMSCLMHLDGLLRRQGQKMRVMHVAEILAGAVR
jgi:L-lactate dehydrogenase complex protein LldE